MTGLFDLTDQVAIITGASRGIGRAIALRMAQAGARVVISSRKADACAEVVDEITGNGGTAMALPCNVSQRHEVEALVSGTRDAWGQVDIVVANAAANPVYGPLRDVSDEAFDKIIDTNLKSHLWLAHATFPEMAERRAGCMIIVSSITGMMGSRNLGAYAISKAADFQLARNLAVEWGRKGIRTNCIAPGLVKTDFARALWENPEAVGYINQMTPLARIGEPDDIAGAAVFLASPSAAFITGQTLVVDGGATIRDFF